jgi:uncharacterized membrane protein YjgN (DUF898 family)
MTDAALDPFGAAYEPPFATAAARPVSPQPVVRASYDERTPGIAGLAFGGSALVVLTFGIYRFWFITRLRRQLWQRSALAGSTFEYTGTVYEIFIGFLMLLAILVPLNLVSWVATLGGPTVQMAVAQVVPWVFMFLILFATFRARRYRLTRTLWRGVRFGQTGSGVSYAFRVSGWCLATVFSLGIAFPFARASLERYRVNNTWYGDQAFASKATGLSMLLPFLGLVAASLLPLVATLAYLAGKPDALAAFWASLEPLADMKPVKLSQAGETLVLAAGWMICGPFVLWPLYRALELRTNIGRVTLGSARFRSTIGAGAFYLRYLATFGLTVVVLIGVGILVSPIFLVAGASSGSTSLAVGGVVVAYLLAYMLMGAVRVWLLTAGLWEAVVTSILVENVDALDRIAARHHDGNAVGDDFASAYDFAGI